MRASANRMSIAAVFLLLAATGSITLAIADDRSPQTTVPNVKVPEGWMLVQEDVWFELADEPHHQFYRAQLAFMDHNQKTASRDVRRGAALIKLAIAHAQGDVKKKLQASAFELELLAERLAAGKVRDSKAMHRIFGRAHYALAAYNQQAAEEHLAHNQPAQATQHLRMASHDMEHGLAWVGGQIIEDTSAIVKRLHDDAVQADSANWLEELRKMIEGVARGVQQLGEAASESKD